MQSACAELYYLSSVWLYHIFPHYLKWYDFGGENVIEHKACVWFSLQLFLESFLILRRTDGNMMKNAYLSLCKVPLMC